MIRDLSMAQFSSVLTDSNRLIYIHFSLRSEKMLVRAQLRKVSNRSHLVISIHRNNLLDLLCSDSEYLAFVEKLKNPIVEHLPSAEVQLEKRLLEEKEVQQPNKFPLFEIYVLICVFLRLEIGNNRWRSSECHHTAYCRSSRKEDEKIRTDRESSLSLLALTVFPLAKASGA